MAPHHPGRANRPALRRYLGTKGRDVRLEQDLGSQLDQSSQVLDGRWSRRSAAPASGRRAASRRCCWPSPGPAARGLPRGDRAAAPGGAAGSPRSARRMNRPETSVQKLWMRALASLRSAMGGDDVRCVIERRSRIAAELRRPDRHRSARSAESPRRRTRTRACCPPCAEYAGASWRPAAARNRQEWLDRYPDIAGRAVGLPRRPGVRPLRRGASARREPVAFRADRPRRRRRN